VITEKLILMLDSQSEDLTKSWTSLLHENENTLIHSKMNRENLAERLQFIYQNLKMWLDEQITPSELAKIFWQLGLDRKKENIALSEIHTALILAKRNLYINILDKLGDDDVSNKQDLIDFSTRFTYFFDKAGYFMIKGYEGFSEPTAEDEAVLDNILAAFRTGSSSST